MKVELAVCVGENVGVMVAVIVLLDVSEGVGDGVAVNGGEATPTMAKQAREETVAWRI